MKSWLSILLIVILAACQNANSKSKNKQNVKPAIFGLFNLTNMYSEAEQNVSFPVWFNDSVVREHKISEIARLIYDVSSMDTTENLIMLPKRELIYQFHKDGTLKQLIVSNFYDDKIISSIKIVFSKFDKQTGYALTKINNEFEYDHKEFPFLRYAKLSGNENLHIFENIETDAKLFIVSNPKLGKPLSIDTLCRPKPEDLIVLGSYLFPTKKYGVKNIVEELNTRTYKYRRGNLVSMRWKDDPFEVKRIFLYAKDGHCYGFKDVTNSMGAYVSSYNYIIEHKDGLPVQVKKILKRDQSKFVLLREDYNYSYFDN